LLSCNQEEIWFHGHFCTAPLTGWVILSSCFLLLLAGYNVHQCTVSYKGISLLYFCRSREIVSFGGVMFRSLKTEPAFFPFCDSDLLGAASDPEKDTDTVPGVMQKNHLVGVISLRHKVCRLWRATKEFEKGCIPGTDRTSTGTVPVWYYSQLAQQLVPSSC
jgi:hypothetical protein